MQKRLFSGLTVIAVLLAAFVFSSSHAKGETPLIGCGDCTTSNHSPSGALDVADCKWFAGWAYDSDTPSGQTTVNIYSDNVFLGSTVTNLPRSDVNSILGISGNHGFGFNTPDSLKDGNVHTVTAVALDNAGDASKNTQLPGPSSTMTIQCSPASSPILIVSDSSVQFNYKLNDPLPTAYLAHISNNSAAQKINYTISVPNQPAWLNSGYATQTLSLDPLQSAGIGVSVNPVGLSDGTYTTNIIFSGNFSNSPAKIAVTLIVSSSNAPIACGDCIPGITISSNPSASNNQITIHTGDQITISGIPLNVNLAAYGTDFTRAFFFDHIFDGDCSNNGGEERSWNITCTATKEGTSDFRVEIYKNGQTYTSNIIHVTVSARAPAVTRPPIGWLDAANCSVISGWTFDQDTPATSIKVRLVDIGDSGKAADIGDFPTDSNRADVNSAYGISGVHGFSVPLPASLKDGTVHQILASGIDSQDGSAPTQLSGSSKSIQCGTGKDITITTSSTLPAAEVGKDYSLNIESSGGPGSPSGSEWSISSGALPLGLYNGSGASYCSATGVGCMYIAGKPTKAGTYVFAVSIKLNGISISKQFTLTVSPTNSITPSAPAQPINNSASAKYTDEFPSGGQLLPGESLQSGSGQYRLVYSYDGNLNIVKSGITVWSSGTGGNPGHTDMQPDGNLVIYNSAGKSVWATYTNGNNGAVAYMENSGNLTIYSDPNVPNNKLLQVVNKKHPSPSNNNPSGPSSTPNPNPIPTTPPSSTGPIVIQSDSVPSGWKGGNYNVSLVSSGGGSGTWSADDVPPGLSFNAAGVFFGVPTTPGNFDTTVSLQSAGQVVKKVFHFVIQIFTGNGNPPSTSGVAGNCPPGVSCSHGETAGGDNIAWSNNGKVCRSGIAGSCPNSHITDDQQEDCTRTAGPTADYSNPNAPWYSLYYSCVGLNNTLEWSNSYLTCTSTRSGVCPNNNPSGCFAYGSDAVTSDGKYTRSYNPNNPAGCNEPVGPSNPDLRWSNHNLTCSALNSAACPSTNPDSCKALGSPAKGTDDRWYRYYDDCTGSLMWSSDNLMCSSKKETACPATNPDSCSALGGSAQGGDGIYYRYYKDCKGKAPDCSTNPQPPGCSGGGGGGGPQNPPSDPSSPNGGIQDCNAFDDCVNACVTAQRRGGDSYGFSVCADECGGYIDDGEYCPEMSPLALAPTNTNLNKGGIINFLASILSGVSMNEPATPTPSPAGIKIPLQVITIHAKGTIANGQYPTMQLKVGDKVFGTWTVTGDWKDYSLAYKGAFNDNPRVYFTNDYFNKKTKEDRNLFIDFITINKTIYSSNSSSTFVSGRYSGKKCDKGYLQTNELDCNNGYFEYPVIKQANPDVTVSDFMHLWMANMFSALW